MSTEIANEGEKNRHHFVPKFYLRNFGTSERAINIINIKRGKAARDVSIRHQCQRHKFYGKDDELENALAKDEGEVAPIINDIITKHTLPPHRSPAYGLLINFIAIQRQRTVGAANRVERSMNAMINSLAEGVARRDPSSEEAEGVRYEITMKDSVILTLQMAESYARCIDDLSLHLVVATGHHQHFITSDHPVFDYNTYCEDVRNHGTLGGACRGIQLFIPLSPKTVLLLYDSTVYKVGGSKKAVITTGITDDEVRALNSLQFVGAHENVYFNEWTDSNSLLQQNNTMAKHRVQKESKADELVEVGNEQMSSMLHLYDQMPNLKLDLSFVRIRKNAKNKPLHERIKPRRTDVLDEIARNMPLPPLLSDGRPHTFRRPPRRN